MNSIVVGIAEYKFAQSPDRLITYGLGSCVAIALYSSEYGLGCMAHIMLPFAYQDERGNTPGKFADSAVAIMVHEMELRGIVPSRIVGKIAGGADMFAGQFKGPGRRIGTRNTMAARKTLDKFGIRLVAQDVGGSAGRSVEFICESGLISVRTLKGEVKEL